MLTRLYIGLHLVPLRGSEEQNYAHAPTRDVDVTGREPPYLKGLGRQE